MIKTVAAAALALTAIAACAETPERQADAVGTAPTGSPANTSAQSPMTVNPAPKGQAVPSTPPTLPEDPARQTEDKAMPPGPVNPGG